MESAPANVPQYPSVWAEYRQKGANAFLYGLSFFFSVPKAEHEISLLEGLTLNDKVLGGDYDLRMLNQVVETAMEPLKAMYRKGALITAALIFAGKTLKIIPFVEVSCYLLAIGLFFVTKDLYSAHQKMAYTLTHFNTLSRNDGSNYPAELGTKIIDDFAQQAVCDMLLFGRGKDAPRFYDYVVEKIQKGEKTVDPYIVTQIFFPALASIAQVTEIARQFAAAPPAEKK